MTHPFQKQLDTARHLEIPPGEHVLNEPLMIPSDSTVYGNGPASVLRFPSIVDGPCVVNDQYRDNQPGNDNITLRHFAVRGSGDGLPSGPIKQFTQGIRLQKVRGFEITGVTGSATGFGMFLVGVEQGIICECHVTATGRDGIHLVAYMNEGTEPFDRRPTRNVVLTRNRVDSVGDDCIAVHCGAESHRNRNTLEAPTGIVFSNNNVGHHPEHPRAQGCGIIFTGVQDGQIIRNNIADTVSCGIWLQEDHHAGVPELEKFQCADIICTNNNLRNVGQVKGARKPRHAMRFKGIRNCRIVDNVSINHGDRSIRANRMKDTDLSNNLFSVAVNRIEIL